MRTKTSERGSARERLLKAASELFYADGVHTVGIDRVIERAGVAKASLYSTFGSKDELIRSYLEGRQQLRSQRIAAKLETCSSPRERVLGIFDVMGEIFADPKFRGCAFLRVSAEARSESVQAICDSMRDWLHSLFTDLARDAGATDPAGLAGQLVLLYDGATIAAQMDRNPGAAADARRAAATLLDAATNR